MFLLLLCLFVSSYLFLYGRGIIQNSTLNIQNLKVGLPGGALGDDVGEVGEGFGGDDVEGDGAGHEYVVVVPLLTSSLRHPKRRGGQKVASVTCARGSETLYG